MLSDNLKLIDVWRWGLELFCVVRETLTGPEKGNAQKVTFKSLRSGLNGDLKVSSKWYHDRIHFQIFPFPGQWGPDSVTLSLSGAREVPRRFFVAFWNEERQKINFGKFRKPHSRENNEETTWSWTWSSSLFLLQLGGTKRLPRRCVTAFYCGE